MRLKQLRVKNYKSLRDIAFAPGDLTAVIGANAAGKSNLADSLDFLSEVYRHGLEVAVGRKGGYENIAFRKMRRSKQPISFSISVELDYSDAEQLFGSARDLFPIRIDHEFAFVAHGYSIRAAFEVVHEHISLSEQGEFGWETVGELTRHESRIEIVTSDNKSISEMPRGGNWLEHHLLNLAQLEPFIEQGQSLSSSELVMAFGRFVPGLHLFNQVAGSMRVFQISPSTSREFGVPTPRPELERWGANLPAVVDLLTKRNPREWDIVLQGMRSILPNLTAIEVDYTSSRRLGLFFLEEGVGRPWSVDEVSDGTIQSLALLVALVDPAFSLVMLEEPENSVHPWIIRHLVGACREAAARRQVVLTTHSPIVINALKPDEVRVMWRESGESHVAALRTLDPSIVSMWEDGEVPTFEYIDSGALLEALPPPPSLLDSEESE